MARTIRYYFQLRTRGYQPATAWRTACYMADRVPATLAMLGIRT